MSPNDSRVFDRSPTPLAASLLAVLLATTPRPASAQESTESCPDGRISHIFVDNHSVFDLSDPDLSQRFSWAYRTANRLHVATRQEVVRRELLFREGDCYDVERLRDSERLLRALDFIAGVDIFGVRQADGSVHVLVDTQDEWSLRIGAAVGGGDRSGLSKVRVREDNLFGTGNQVAAFYTDRPDEHVYGGSFFSPQLFGTRWDGLLEAGKTRVGYLANEVLTYPFVGEQGRFGLRQTFRHNDEYFEFLMPMNDDLARVWLPERRVVADLGVAARFGRDQFHRILLGGSLSGEWIAYPAPPRYADRDEMLLAGAPPFPDVPMDSLARVRLLMLLGQRNVYFVQGKRLDTVNGTEDVRLGVESEIALGPTIPGISRGRDLALDMGLYAGGEMPGVGIAGAHLILEARRDYDSAPPRSEWSDIFAQFTGWTYLRPNPDGNGVVVASVTAAGGWNNRVPFQLTLGRDAGLRGYARDVDPGGQRVVATIEGRKYLGWPLPDLFDLGGVAFVDVGRIWAGDARFGTSSPMRADVGVGLRAAFPPGSRRTLRLDIGVPVESGLGMRDVVFSVGIGQLIGLRSVGRDPQLLRSTRMGSSAATFVFPSF
jgi:hypothetical protein